MARLGYKKLHPEIAEAIGRTFVPPRLAKQLTKIYEQELAARKRRRKPRPKPRKRPRPKPRPKRKPKAFEFVPRRREAIIPRPKRFGAKPLPPLPTMREVLIASLSDFPNIGFIEEIAPVDHPPFGNDWTSLSVTLTEPATLAMEQNREYLATVMQKIQDAIEAGGYGNERAIVSVMRHDVHVDADGEQTDFGIVPRGVGMWQEIKGIDAYGRTLETLTAWEGGDKYELLDMSIVSLSIDVPPIGSLRRKPV